LVETLGKSLQPAVDLLVNLFQGLMTILRPVISAFGDILTPIITALVNVLNPLVTILSKHLLPIFEFIGKWVGIISTAIGVLIQLLSEGLGSALTALANLIKDVIGGIPTFFQNVVKFVENAINSMIGLINNLIDRINGIGQAIGLTIPKIKDVEFNITSHQTSSVQPPSKTAETITSGVKAQQTVAATPNVASAIVTNNNDYSSKQITISPGAVVINNYAADIDSLELAEAVNRKLAELL
jgi:phage-related protein